MPRKVFFSFHYKPDHWRAAQVRSIGALDGNQPAEDNDWESVKKGGDAAIEAWIARQMSGRTCTVVLVGEATCGRKWITHEIVQSWNAGMGVVGIRIHGLKHLDGETSTMGGNPFDHVRHNPTNSNLSTIVKCYTPAGTTSQERHRWIAQYLEAAIEEAIQIRKSY